MMTPPPQPRAERLVTLLLMGKLISPHGEALCRIRNMSCGGLMAEAHVPLQFDDRVEIQWNGNAPLSGTVRWTKDGRVGLQFHEIVDVAEMLRRGGDVVQDHMLTHGPHFAVECGADIHLFGRSFRSELRSIAQRGALLKTELVGQSGRLVSLHLPDLPEREAYLTQQGGGLVSLNLTEAYPFHDLAPWLAQRRWSHGDERSN